MHGQEVVFEFRAHLLEYEKYAGERRVERCCQPPARARSDERMRVVLIHLEKIGDHLSDVAAHLNCRALPSQDHAAAQGAETAQEFDGQDVFPSDRPNVVKRPFDLVDAAAARFRGYSPYEEKCDVNEDGGKEDRGGQLECRSLGNDFKKQLS